MDYLKGLIVVTGPTASGKSELALNLAKEFNGELICSDSMQVYRKLNIGTSKPSKKEQELVPHHQIDIIEPNEFYSAGSFAKDTSKIINKIHKRGNLPILVGGSGLYFKALMYGLSQIPKIPKIIKEQVNNLQIENGTNYCWEKLKTLDPQIAKIIHPNDTYRILRSLEVHIATGSSIMDFQKKQPFSEARYPFLAIATKWERKILYERINQRTHKMLESGWIEEVINLIKNFPKNSKPFQSIGYREIIQYLTGELKYHQMVTLIQRRTRRYAKRQMTWFRKESTIEWIEPKDFSLAKSKTKVFLEK